MQIYKDPTLTIGPDIVAAVVQSGVQALNGARAAALTSAQLAVSAGLTDPAALADLATKAATAFSQSARAGAPVVLDARAPSTGGKAQRDPSVATQVLVGMMIFFMLFGASTQARSIIDEHRLGTLSRLFTTPTPRWVILGGKYVAVFLAVLIQSVILLLAGRLFFGAHWGEIGPVVVLTLCGALVAASLALLMVSFAKTPAQAGAISSAVFVFLALIGGNFVGTVNIGGPYALVRRFTPNGWLLEGWDHLLFGGSWDGVAVPIAASLGFSVVFFALATLVLPETLRVSRVWRIATKELLQTRRDRLAALFTIVLPVIFTVFLGLIFGGAGSSRIPLAVADADGTPASVQLLEQLRAAPLVELKVMTAGEVDAAVQGQSVGAALVIPAGYGAALQAGRSVALTFVRIETSSGAQSLSEAVQAVVGESNSRILVARISAEQVSLATGRAPDEALVASAGTLAAAALAAPVVSVKTSDSGSTIVQHTGGFQQSSSGSLVNWVLFSLLTVATGMAWERRRGLLRRLSAAGVRGRQVIGGKMLAMVIITFLQQTFLILLGRFAFGVDYLRSPLALLMVMISLSVLAASFGLLISSAFRSEQAVIATTVISAQLLAVLGGAWFPLEVTSGSFSRVAHFLPTAWVMDSLHGIILKGWGAGDVLGPMGIVWAWIVVLFAVAVWRFRPE